MSDPTPESPRPRLVLTEAGLLAAATVLDPDAFATGPWPDTHTATRAEARESAVTLARAVLLAAEPHLAERDDVQAEGWDEGWVDGYDDHESFQHPQSTGTPTMNPWRPKDEAWAAHPLWKRP